VLDLLVIPGGLPIASIGLVGGTAAILHQHRKRAAKRPAWPWALHVVGMIVLGVLAAIPATQYGIRHFCTPGAGAQCGLGGALGFGPMAFGLAALLYAAAYAIWDVE
jgi:hypothetical protein